MPLLSGKKNMGRNIAELENSGYKPKQAIAIGYKKAGERKSDSETIIPSSKPGNIKNPGANQKYVNSRQGGPSEQRQTKLKSIKHENPEFFKRQSDRKKMDQTGFQEKEFYKGNKY
jgi:hypothetical protein